MSSSVSLFFILFFFACGYFTGRLVRIPRVIPQRLNWAVINLIFPAIILLNIPLLSFQTEYLFLVVAPWIMIACIALILLLLRRRHGWSPELLCACLVLAPMGNTGNLGYPMLKAFFTDAQAAMGIIFDQLGTFIALCTYATILIAIYAGKGSVSAAQILARIFRFPPFITLLVALLVPAFWLVEPIHSLLRWISYCIVPLSMFSIGLQFRFSGLIGDSRPLAWTLSLKMLLAPLLVYLVGSALGIADEMLDVAVFQAAMPPMVAGVVLLLAQGLASRFAISVLGLGTLLALAYLPVLGWLLNIN